MTTPVTAPAPSSRPGTGASVGARRGHGHAERTRTRRATGRGTWAGIAFVAPLVAYLALLYGAPLWENVSLSLHRYTRATFVTGEAPFTGLQVYREVMSSAQFWPTVGHTAFFVGVSLLFQYTIGLALAVFFQRSFPLSALLRALFLVPWLLPIIVSATTWQWMFDADSGVLNRLLGVVGIDPVWWLSSEHALVSVTIANIWLGIPFNLVILYSGLQNIPAELYEAAAVDGASGVRQFWSITMPLLRPVSAICLLLGFVYTLKVVDVIWIMTFGSGTSQTMATWAYGMAFGKGTTSVVQYSEAAVVGTLLLLVALGMGIFYVLVQHRQEVAGR